MIKPDLQVGAAELSITPKAMEVELTGFAARHPFTAAGVHDSIFAHCLALSNGRRELLLISLDLLAFSVSGARRIRAEVAAATGITAQRIMLATTHTHSAPATVPLRRCGKSNPVYVKFVRSRIVLAARQALRSMVRARVRAANTRAWLGMNRREADSDLVSNLNGYADLGMVDPHLGALSFEDARGRTRAVVVNYGMHPVCLGSGNRLISADYPAYLYQSLKKRFGDRVAVLFLNGSAGDVNPRVRGGFRAARALGTRLAAAVVQSLRGAATTEKGDASLRCALRRVELPYGLAATRRRARAYACRNGIGDRGRTAQIEWGVRMLSADRRGRLPRFIRAPVQAMRIGPVCIVATPCELLTRVGAEIRRRAKRTRLWLASCANGDVGYVPAGDDFPQRGYEVDTAHLYYDAPQFARGVGSVLAREAAKLAVSISVAPEPVRQDKSERWGR